MGVAGSGKSSAGRALARRLGWSFIEGDDFHPPQNVAKMSRGDPLEDADRLPWLDRLCEAAAGELAAGRSAVIACSALKKSYRERLRVGEGDVQFVYLRGSFDRIAGRLRAREDHFMKEALLASQFDALEEPAAGEAFVVDIDPPVDQIVDRIAAWLG